MAPLKNMAGEMIGRLTVLERVENDGDGRALWLCECECGNQKVIAGKSLRRGLSKSCGCLSREMTSSRASTHGLSKHPLYAIWSNMVSRTENSRVPHYHVYGGRGISMCRDWRNNFENFYEWALENIWKKGLDIDRIDPDGNYSPENCRIVSRSVNNANRSQKYKGKPIGVNQEKRGGRWTAQLRYEGKLHWIGTFKTQIEAVRARNEYIIANGLPHTINIEVR